MKSKNFFLILLCSTFLLTVFFLLTSGNLPFSQENCECANQNLSGEFEKGEKMAYFEGLEVSPPLASVWELSPKERRVLGEETGEEKWIEVDLSEQKIKAWEGTKLFLESLISSGKWGRTPTGEFRIWSKFKYTKMSGGSKELHTYYYLPNVPYTMYFYNGFGLHGTYWHNNFGTPMSHGCINLPTPVAEKLFYWSTPSVGNKNAIMASADNPGTKVVIHE